MPVNLIEIGYSIFEEITEDLISLIFRSVTHFKISFYRFKRKVPQKLQIFTRFYHCTSHYMRHITFKLLWPTH